MASSPKVVLVTNIPTPYRIPLFNELSRQLVDRGFDFHVVFAAVGYERRKWKADLKDCKFNYSVLPVGRAGTFLRNKGVFLYSGLIQFLLSSRATVVVTGGFGLATIKIWLLSLLGKAKYVVWSGAVLFDWMQESWLRRWLRRRLVRRAASCVAYGSDARQYLIGCGAPPENVSIAINTVDVSFFADFAGVARARRLPSTSEARVLYVGELSGRKGVDQVLRAAAIVLQSHPRAIFDIVGSGKQEVQLKAMAVEMGIADQVVFHGFKQKAEIADFLGRASCFLFCTNFDIWGLVLVEAMAASLPCLASIRGGSTRDLIHDNVTGFAVDFAEPANVAERINWLLEHPAEAAEMGESASKWMATNVNLSRSAEGFVTAVERATGSGIDQNLSRDHLLGICADFTIRVTRTNTNSYFLKSLSL